MHLCIEIKDEYVGCTHLKQERLSTYLFQTRCRGKEVIARARVDAETKRKDMSKLADVSALAFWGRLLCAFYQHFAKCLQWCVRKHIFVI